MDFALLASDNNNLNAAAFSLQNAAADANKQKCYGFGFLKQERAVNEEDTREFKMAKTCCSSSSSCGEGVLRYPLHRSNGCNLSSAEGQQQQQHHQMLSFSSPNSQPPPLTLPYYHYTSNAFARINAGINGGSTQQQGQGQGQGVRGPFTPSQWMELEHQALIYKYISANVPIPSYLLNPIRKAFQSVAAGFSALRSNPPLGWSGFQLGFSNSDPEPGRCRRTDGKKWRCSRDAVVDQKYCERHMNRGRHRSRKPVEPPQTNPPTIPTTTTYKINAGADKQPNAAIASSKVEAAAAKDGEHYRSSNAFQESRQEFGLVCSDSLLNPLNRTSSLRQFMDDWPKNQTDRSEPDRTQLSISIPIPIPMVTSDLMSSTSSPTNHNNSLTPSDPHRLSRELEMGLGVGNIDAPNLNQRQTTSWVPISWEPTSIGGPLGEVLHNTNTNTNTKQLNLMDNWDHSPRRLASSPTGVLQRGAFASLSNSSAASSPRHDGSTQCNMMLINPSLPAL